MITGTVNHLQKDASTGTQLTQLDSPYGNIQSTLTLLSQKCRKWDGFTWWHMCNNQINGLWFVIEVKLVNVAIIPLICTWNVPCLYLVWDTDCSDCMFHGLKKICFQSIFQINMLIVPDDFHLIVLVYLWILTLTFHILRVYCKNCCITCQGCENSHFMNKRIFNCLAEDKQEIEDCLMTDTFGQERDFQPQITNQIVQHLPHWNTFMVVIWFVNSTALGQFSHVSYIYYSFYDTVIHAK